MREPTQYIYDNLFLIAKNEGFRVYDFTPRDEVPYPFIVLQSAELQPRATKGYWLTSITQFIDIYGDATSRKTVSDIAQTLLAEAGKIQEAHVDAEQSYVTIIQDQSTAQDLWHARVQITFKL